MIEDLDVGFCAGVMVHWVGDVVQNHIFGSAGRAFLFIFCCGDSIHSNSRG